MAVNGTRSYLIQHPWFCAAMALIALLASALAARLGGWFHPALTWLVAGLFLAWMGVRRSPRAIDPPPPATPWKAIAPIALALGVFYSLTPSENLAGNWDPGVYIAQGVAATRSIDWTLPDSAANLVDKDTRRILYPRDRNQRVKMPGFYAPRDRPDQLIPQFSPLYPTALALAFSIGGLPLALRVDALCILAALLLLADLAARLTRRPAASVICLVIAGLHPATVWFARFHTCESLAFLLFVLLGHALFLLFEQSNKRSAGIAAGCLMLLPWTTTTAIPVAALALLLLPVRRIPIRERLLIASGSICGIASTAAFFMATNHPYAAHIGRFIPTAKLLLPSLPLKTMAIAGVGLLIGALGIAMAKSWIERHPPHTTRTGLLITGLTAASLFASYILLPYLPPFLNGILALLPLPFWLWFGIGITSAWPSPAGLRGWLWWPAAAALTGGLFLLWPMVPQHYPWAWKRWIWMLFPAVILLAVTGLVGGRNGASGRSIRWLCLSTTLLLSLPMYYHAGLLRGGEWKGFSAWLEQLSAAIPRNVLIMAPKDIATPLEFIHHHAVLPVYGGVDGLRDHYYRTLWSSGSPGREVWLIDSEPPAWLPEEIPPVAALPEYTGFWIKQNRYPTDFQTQPRGYTLFIWTAGPPSPEALEPSRHATD